MRPSGGRRPTEDHALTYPTPYLSEKLQNRGRSLISGPGLVVCQTASAYCPRNPEATVLYGVVAANLETFLSRQQERDRLVPRFVEQELRAFL